MSSRAPAKRAIALDELMRKAAEMSGRPIESIRAVRAPYRFCPIGAHLDHQDGEVTGFALDRALYIAYAPNETGCVRLRSLDLPGEVAFDVTRVPEKAAGDWGDYPRGAAAATAARCELRHGITGIVAGEMRPGGVSTSAALGVACLLALQDANGNALSREDNVELDQAIENGYLGLQNGILDQSVILYAKRGSLLHLDCRSRQVALHPRPDRTAPFALLAVFSGVEHALVATGYNRRVEECRRAAGKLLSAAGMLVPTVARLRDVPAAVFERHVDSLDDTERRRVTHYVEEMGRVRDGVAAWRAGDLSRFGAIVTGTGLSSIHNYECGSPELIRLFEILARRNGVYGARFSGAGFRGYCTALLDPSRTDEVAEDVRDAYLRDFPHHAAAFHVHVCDQADGAGFVAAGQR